MYYLESISSLMGFNEKEVNQSDYATKRYLYTFLIGESILFNMCGPISKRGRITTLVMSGQGCRDFERHSNLSWKDFLHILIYDFSGIATRVDYSRDTFSNKINMDEVNKRIQKREYTTSFRAKPIYIGNDESGITYEFGSRISTQMLVIYDKKKEREKNDFMSSVENWTRFEMRFLKEKAHEFLVEFVEKNEDEQFDFYCGLLRGLLDFKIDKGKYRNTYKLDTCDWWKDFLNNNSKVKIRCQLEVENKLTFEKKREWFKNNMGGMLAMIFLADPGNFEKFLDNAIISLADNNKIKQKILNRVNTYLLDKNISEIKPEELIYDMDEANFRIDILRAKYDEKYLPF